MQYDHFCYKSYRICLHALYTTKCIGVPDAHMDIQHGGHAAMSEQPVLHNNKR